MDDTNFDKNTKQDVDGIIMILSCQKYKDSRLKEFSLSKTNYNNWEVIYVIGDLFLEKNYVLDGNMLYVRCEDSYIHLLKKLALAMKYIKENFNIKEGILRCSDDLIFNEDNLVKFLNGVKFDYYGQSPNQLGLGYICDKNTLKNVTIDNWMINYYKDHQEDFKNPQHGLINMDITILSKYRARPQVCGAAGVIIYLSNKACDIIISHMETINFNIFEYNSFTGSYPYTIEDCAISFIMYYNDIVYRNANFFYDTNHVDNIGFHTNKYK